MVLIYSLKRKKEKKICFGLIIIYIEERRTKKKRLQHQKYIFCRVVHILLVNFKNLYMVLGKIYLNFLRMAI